MKRDKWSLPRVATPQTQEAVRPGGDGGLKDGVTLAATQEGADSRIRADDRRRRWFAGELYTVSPDLARDLETD